MFVITAFNFEYNAIRTISFPIVRYICVRLCQTLLATRRATTSSLNNVQIKINTYITLKSTNHDSVKRTIGHDIESLSHGGYFARPRDPFKT